MLLCEGRQLSFEMTAQASSIRCLAFCVGIREGKQQDQQAKTWQRHFHQGIPGRIPRPQSSAYKGSTSFGQASDAQINTLHVCIFQQANTRNHGQIPTQSECENFFEGNRFFKSIRIRVHRTEVSRPKPRGGQDIFQNMIYNNNII